MTIQINTDNNIIGNEQLEAHFTTLISDKLNRFSNKITRIEVHLSDENSNKNGGIDDIRCLIEARIEGKQPVSATNLADSNDNAIIGAIDKLRSSLDTIFGKMGNF